MEIADYLRFVFALAFVIGLIALLAFLAKRYGMGYRNVQGAGKHRRLSISEIMPLDAKRRLVLVKRDNTEHLLVIGGPHDLVVERDVKDSDMSFSDHLQHIETPKDSDIIAKDEVAK